MSAALPAEPDAKPVRLVLDLDPRSEPVAGTLTADSGAAAPFTGWVGLTRAIELALAAERGAAARGGGEAGPPTVRPGEGAS